MVSVIIPVYNVEKYIERCICSVVAQSYKDIEIVLVDDCGQDNSIAIAESVLKEVSGLKYRVECHGHNRGLSAARNTGIDVAEGQYVYFLDSDDWLPEKALQNLVEVAEKNHSQCVVGEYADCKDDTGEMLVVPYKYTDDLSCSSSEETINLFTRKSIPVTAWNKLVDRNFLLANNLYFENGIYHEDCLWTFRLMACLASLSVVSEVTYCYSTNPDSIMNQFDSEKMKRRVDSSVVVLDKMVKTLPLLHGASRDKMLVYIYEMRNYMYRRLLADGMDCDTFLFFYRISRMPMDVKYWMASPLKLKIAHIDQLLPECLGYRYFLFLNKYLYKK